jgi:NAD-dependent dihydropyrimidine dehydrogenase PreA subunit
MAYVIASTCIDVKDGACQEVCPVECIYEGGRMMYIQPAECIDCGLCLSVCPVDAIYAGGDLPESERAFERANAEFFGSVVTGWGRCATGDVEARRIMETWRVLADGFARRKRERRLHHRRDALLRQRRTRS